MLGDHLKLLAQMTAISVVGGLMYLLPRFYQQRIVNELQRAPAAQSCIVCAGSERLPCLMCGGKGERLVLTMAPAWGSQSNVPTRPPICESCNGSGKVWCPACRK